MNEQNKKAMINCLSLLAVAVGDNDEDMLRSYLEGSEHTIENLREFYSQLRSVS